MTSQISPDFTGWGLFTICAIPIEKCFLRYFCLVEHFKQLDSVAESWVWQFVKIIKLLIDRILLNWVISPSSSRPEPPSVKEKELRTL